MRTDATRFCPYCVVRFGRVERCPRCDLRAFDLSKLAGRREALTALTRGSLGREMPQALPLRLVSLWLKRGFLPVCALGFVLGLIYRVELGGGHGVGGALGLRGHGVGSGLGTAGVAAMAQLALMLALLALYFSGLWLRSLLKLGGRRHGANAGSEDLRDRMQLVTPPEGLGPSLTLEGVVRGEATLSSPLSHATCVAYRLLGRGPVGVVDDAAALSFMLEMDDGTTTRVEASRCSLDLPVTQEPRALRPDHELTSFLERRGVFPERGPLHLAEGLLRDGDRVIVEGAEARPTAESDGYRGRRALRVIRETSETPLRIRRVSSAGAA